jgi:hypothetical protein
MLLGTMKLLPTDFEPWGRRDRDKDYGPDCSCGCKFFMELPGKLGMDWGVCVNKESPRRGLLTFEHQGCLKFKSAPDDGMSVSERSQDGPPWSAELPITDMIEVLSAPLRRRAELAVAVVVGELGFNLWTADGRAHAGSLSIFKPSGTGLKPDFSKPRVVDHGSAIALGKYEAAVDAMLEYLATKGIKT